MFILDTSPCIDILRNRESAVKDRLARHDPSDIYLCSIVVAELLYGARKSASTAKNLALVLEFCEPFVSMPFDDRCAHQYALIRLDLERAGARIGANDLFIAAVAKTHDLILVTHNTNEFRRIPGLQVEDWRE